MTKYYKKGYPRPQFVRESYFSLNGEWDFRFDFQNDGLQNGWQNGFKDQKIKVPFSYESKASGIEKQKACSIVWYSRDMNWKRQKGKKVFLNFEGSDYRTDVWVNGIYIGFHEGGYTRFTFDITAAYAQTNNTIVCRIEDSLSTIQPRGKQRWLERNYDCWYTQTTGIWKDVWAEQTDFSYLKELYLTPLYDDNALELEYELSSDLTEITDSLELETIITFENFTIYSSKDKVVKNSSTKKVSLINDMIKWKVRYWCPKSPNLYDVCIRLIRNGTVIDEVGSYFGLRKISADTGRIKLNNMDFYLKMILDQGYWSSSLLTPPDEEALIQDIRKILEYGYNGVRKHQKIEDERFYYWADVMGLVVWCEAPSFYEFNRRAIECVTKEWIEIVKQHYNHPSVITWVPFNESWGIPRILCNENQQRFTESIYYLTKSLDNTRPVISNDGWEHTKSDIITLHDYAENGEELLSHWKNPEKNLEGHNSFNGEKYAFAGNAHYEGQPIILSEFGGIALGKEKDGWGYGTAETTEENYLNRMKSLTDALSSMDYFCGYCYTQLTDVEQEQNGHMDMNHLDKINAEKIRAIITAPLSSRKLSLSGYKYNKKGNDDGEEYK